MIDNLSNQNQALKLITSNGDAGNILAIAKYLNEVLKAGITSVKVEAFFNFCLSLLFSNCLVVWSVALFEGLIFHILYLLGQTMHCNSKVLMIWDKK